MELVDQVLMMIIDTIQTRGYVELVDKTFKPTESGILTSDRLTQFFNDIINVEYTAQMEKRTRRYCRRTR